MSERVPTDADIRDAADRPWVSGLSPQTAFATGADWMRNAMLVMKNPTVTVTPPLEDDHRMEEIELLLVEHRYIVERLGAGTITPSEGRDWLRARGHDLPEWTTPGKTEP